MRNRLSSEGFPTRPHSALLFRQIRGEVFEDKAGNILCSLISYTDDTPLVKFAKGKALNNYKAPILRCSAQTHHYQRWRTWRFQIWGLLVQTEGGALQAVLMDGRGFFPIDCKVLSKEFAEEEYITSSITHVLVEYFAMARIRADVGQNAKENIQPFPTALARLAGLSQVEERLLR